MHGHGYRHTGTAVIINEHSKDSVYLYSTGCFRVATIERIFGKPPPADKRGHNVT
mgnify:CR=1 FL=1